MKKIFSLFLAVLMLIPFLPQAHAETVTQYIELPTQTNAAVAGYDEPLYVLENNYHKQISVTYRQQTLTKYTDAKGNRYSVDELASQWTASNGKVYPSTQLFVQSSLKTYTRAHKTVLGINRFWYVNDNDSSDTTSTAYSAKQARTNFKGVSQFESDGATGNLKSDDKWYVAAVYTTVDTEQEIQDVYTYSDGTESIGQNTACPFTLYRKVVTVIPAPTEPTPEETNPDYVIPTFNVPDNEAMRFVRNLRLGWNLGNTFEAYDENLSNELDYESVWNGVKTTPELISALKSAGFRAIRIPVSWHNHLTDTQSYTISAQWLDRVNEVVDYAIKQGMYVILNIHHDDGKSFVYPSKDKSSQSAAYITAIWEQLAERFRNYDNHLIFESLNEPRLVGHVYEWNLVSISPACKEAVKQINLFNQTFVNVVRSSGGNNRSRYLLCPGYDASPDGALNSGYQLPTDPTGNQNKLIVSVHGYKPNSFAMLAAGFSNWSSRNNSDRNGVTEFMDKLYNKYTSKGIPVLIDEFGAREKSSNTYARADYAGFYVASARARGMTCLWWDNNLFSGSGERFGLLDRSSLRWVYPEIMNAMVRNAK